jgi:hypothetical protein
MTAAAARILELLQSASLRDGDRAARSAAWNEIYRIREAHREEFARSRGWICARTSFSVEQLREGRHGRFRVEDYGNQYQPIVDHAEHYRWPVRPFRPAAIVTHSYAPADAVVRWAAEHGLEAEVLPWSWYFPGHATAVVLARASNVIRVDFSDRKEIAL